MIPLPTVGSTNAFLFTTKFSKLNDIYTLQETMSYGEAVTLNIDFITYLYQPAGLTVKDYAADANNYINDTILYLTPANATGTIIYVPSSVLGAIPDPMVGCYNDLAIGMSLGLFSDPKQLDWLINEVTTIVSSVLGIKNPETKLYSLGTQYMRVVDYEALVNLRKDAQLQYTTLYEQLQEQISLTEAAQNLNVYYQETLIKLSTGGT